MKCGLSITEEDKLELCFPYKKMTCWQTVSDQWIDQRGGTTSQCDLTVYMLDELLHCYIKETCKYHVNFLISGNSPWIQILNCSLWAAYWKCGNGWLPSTFWHLHLTDRLIIGWLNKSCPFKIDFCPRQMIYTGHQENRSLEMQSLALLEACQRKKPCIHPELAMS